MIQAAQATIKFQTIFVRDKNVKQKEQQVFKLLGPLLNTCFRSKTLTGPWAISCGARLKLFLDALKNLIE